MNVLATIFQWLGYAQYNATPPTASSGQNVPLQCDGNGNLLVNVVTVAGGTGLVTRPAVVGTSPTVPVAAAIGPSTDQPFNTYAGLVALTAPTSPLVGTTFRARDVGAAVATYGATLVDPAGYLLQNPIDGQLYAEISWGPGSGGAPNPNLGALSSMTWVFTSVTRGATTTFFWQAVT